jgi:hypothetical protein
MRALLRRLGVCQVVGLIRDPVSIVDQDRAPPGDEHRPAKLSLSGKALEITGHGLLALSAISSRSGRRPAAQNQHRQGAAGEPMNRHTAAPRGEREQRSALHRQDLLQLGHHFHQIAL